MPTSQLTFRLQPIVEIVPVQAPALLEDLVRSPRNFILNRARPRLEVHNQAFQLSRSIERRVTIRQVRRRGLPDVLPIAIDSDEPTNRQGGYQMSNVEAIQVRPKLRLVTSRHTALWTHAI